MKQKTSLDISCLGCVPYFVMNWNIYHMDINKSIFAIPGKSADIFGAYNVNERLNKNKNRDHVRTGKEN